MDLRLLQPSPGFSAVRFFPRRSPPTPLCRRFLTVRSSLPFPNEKAKYHKELEAAVEMVERACRLCVDVQRSLFFDEGGVLKKNDQTPVTVADFGVQALVSLGLSKLFPAIPLVAEEDSAFLRSNNLVDPVVNAVSDKMSFDEESLSHADVLEAIDRGGKNAFAFGTKPATYWILDPIDGTRGFVKGSQALYVVGLSLVVEGEIVLGVMGCPNWVVDTSYKSTSDDEGCKNSSSELGIIMVAHVGCGTWTKSRFCIPESQTWESLPLSALYKARIDDDYIGDKEIRLLPTCCGSLCKYLMVASGRASIFFLRARSQTVIKAWDHAVGIICVREAGGKVTDWKGSELDLAADQVERRIIYPAGGIIVTNGNIHEQTLEIISSISTVV
ncbi:hypothetical protein PTKIN_Ptkin01aG0127700 [Pterospermum kingtungense]